MKLVPFVIALILMLAFLFAGGLYLAEQGVYLLSWLLRARPVERSLADPRLPEDTRRLLETATAVRGFAADVLGLRTGRSFGVYIETGKEHLVDVVTACREDAFEARTWRFPVVGEVPYKGFYRREQAQQLAAELKKDGWDVIVRPVDAFSSLGFFPDPLYDFMRDYDEYRLAELIIHELTHKTVFIPGEAQFNEELATFVGIEGAIRYSEDGSAGEAELREGLELARRDRERFLTLMRDLYAELDEIYSADLPRSEKLARKSGILESFRLRMERDYDALFVTGSYRFLTEIPLNNAYILSWNIYAGDLGLYREVLDRYGGDLRRFIEEMRTIGRQGGNPKQAIRRLLE